jgi:hypothetical protein
VGSSGRNLAGKGRFLVAGLMPGFKYRSGRDKVIAASVKPALKEFIACSQTTVRNIQKIMSPQ